MSVDLNTSYTTRMESLNRIFNWWLTSWWAIAVNFSCSFSSSLSVFPSTTMTPSYISCLIKSSDSSCSSDTYSRCLNKTQPRHAKVVSYSIYERWPRSWSQSLDSQPAGDWVINPEVGYHYFPSGPQLPFQPKSITAPSLVPTYTAWWQRHMGVSSLPKATAQWCPTRIWTRDLRFASLMSYQ